jgi:hypothetical protein
MLLTPERPVMKLLLPLFSALVAGVLVPTVAPVSAGEAAVWRYDRHSAEPAFPLSKRAQSIWASGACWSDCGTSTTWNLTACLERDMQGRCLKRADAADCACQRACRTRGGPLLPIDF